MKHLALFLLFVVNTAYADTVVATRTIRAHEIIAPQDVQAKAVTIVGGLDRVESVIGQEARVVLYPGRPIRKNDIGPPALIERNQVIPLIYSSGGLSIATDGRAMDRAAAGEWIRVMNLASRTTVSAIVAENGSAYVRQ